MGYRGHESSICYLHPLETMMRFKKNYTSEHLFDEITVSMEDPNPNIIDTASLSKISKDNEIDCFTQAGKEQ